MSKASVQKVGFQLFVKKVKSEILVNLSCLSAHSTYSRSSRALVGGQLRVLPAQRRECYYGHELPEGLRERRANLKKIDSQFLAKT